ncbi:50S ribosomal protein L4 [Candidatus Berkelbacteria bacterium]|nr:50S ribosomal protein L4 [Candidatus Berkelbacteria bacterium]
MVQTCAVTKKTAAKVAPKVAVKPTIKTAKPAQAAKMNARLVAQVIHVLMERQRKATSHTKNRGAVSGGGKKPWKQKGTGRARVGSIRSPLWRGGGIVFGPRKERHYKLDAPKGMRIAALRELVAVKKHEGSLMTTEKWPFTKGKTKEAVAFLQGLKKEGSFLFITGKQTDPFKHATRNLPYVSAVSVQNVNAQDILVADHVVIEKAAVKQLEERLQ